MVEQYASSYEPLLRMPDGPMPPVLIVRALADEASAVLSLVLVGSLISATLWGKIA